MVSEKRLVLIHGINNENNSAQYIHDSWMAALLHEWRGQRLAPPPKLNVSVAYYAPDLAGFAAAARGATKAGASGDEPSPVEIEILQALVDAHGVTDEQIQVAARQENVDLSRMTAGAPNEAWVIAAGRALENTLPSRGKYLARMFARQASVYIEKSPVQTKIKNLVRSQVFIDDLPIVVVAHSLGTVIGYELLTEKRGQLDVPLFCTLGSPLGIRIVRDYIGKRTTFPRPPISRWLNGVHKQDFVTMGRLLDASTLGFDGVENDSAIVNRDEDKHNVLAYLRTPAIAASVHKALTE